MGLAIDQSLVDGTADPSDVKASCQTSNCTFEPYSTLRVCSRVDDVTPDLVRQCPKNDLDGFNAGCSYDVKELLAHPPYRVGNLSTESIHGSPIYTLWLGASDIVNDQSDQRSYTYPNPNTLVEFYAIYVLNTSVFPESPSFDRSSTANFSDMVVALKGGLDLCVAQYNTTVINGTTKTVELNQSSDLKWATVEKTVGTTSFSVVSSTTSGAEHWMEMNTVNTFNNFLTFEIFRGASSQGIQVQNAGSGSETTEGDAPATIAPLLLNQDRAKGKDALKKLLDTLGTSMTNA